VKKSVRGAIVAVSLVVGLTGCGAGGAGQDGEVEISFLVFETPNLTPEFWDSAIERFEADNPQITVTKIVSPDVDRDGYAQTLLSTGQFPDVQIALSPTALVEAGALMPFEPEDLAEFLQPDAGSIEGKQYQMPWMAQGIPLMFYNKDLFAQAGLTETPTTWAELLDVAEKLKAAGITPFQIGGGGTDSWASAILFDSIVSANLYATDPDWITRRHENQVAFSDPEFVETLIAFKDLVDNGYVNTDALSLSYPQLQDAFLAGNAAMYPMGTWFAAPAEGATFEVGVFPVPGFDGNHAVPVFTGGGITVSAQSEHPEEARRFAVWFSTDQDNLTAFMRADALFPVVDGYTLPDDVSQIFSESYAVTMDAVQKTGAFAWEAGDRSLLPGFPDTLYSAVQSILTGGSVADAAATLDAKWDELSAN
jgi:ABC-type glycerol-3-phosphate transport system substrate-binding protein